MKGISPSIKSWQKSGEEKADKNRFVVSKRLSAYTLVEILVVIGIIGAVLGLLLPAVMQSRASSRNLQCKNNLRNIGLGIAQFESVNRKYPGVYAGLVGSKKTGTYVSFSPSSSIAAYIDSNTLSNAVPTVQPIDDPDPDWTKSELASPAILRCPDDTRSLKAASNYRFCRGLLPTWPQDPGGAFVRNDQGFTAADIIDGLSATAFASERLTSESQERERNRIFAIVNGEEGTVVTGDCIKLNRESSLDQISPSSQATGNSWMSGRWIHASYYHIFTPNSKLIDCMSERGLNMAVITARSNHNNGVNVLFGDGAVKFETNEINLQVWRAMGTRNAQEPDSSN